MAFTPGQTLIRGDLAIYLVDSNTNPTNPYEITYAIYYVQDYGLPAETEILIGSATRTPVNPTVGEFYASLMVPPSATIGYYRIRWHFREDSGAAITTVVQEWQVASASTLTAATYSTAEQDMILKLRRLIRDNAPDRHYHFRPPEHEGRLNQYNQVFGRIWDDDELLEYLERSLDTWNAAPPETEDLSTIDTLVGSKPVWRTAILWGAITHAAMALAFNWVADEFSIISSTLVRVYFPNGGGFLDLTIADLYEICNGKVAGAAEYITEAFKSGKLTVDSVDVSTGKVIRMPVKAVLRHNTAHKELIRVDLVDGRTVTTTEDHSLFQQIGGKLWPMATGNLAPDETIVVVKEGKIVDGKIKDLTLLPPDQYTYDLSVPGPENFVLANGILAHNSYSIGGISLDLERSSKYESLKQNAEQQFDKATEHKARTTKIMRGLQQPRYGISVRSSFGPSLSRGIVSPRSFMVLPWLFVCGTMLLSLLEPSSTMFV